MSILLPVHKIKPPLWMRDPDLILILNTLNKGDLNARMVGGCIRNYYMNKDIYDIDIACKLNPEISAERLHQNNIKTIATGIEYGTITAHINGKNFEITTLRKDVHTDGRHAKVVFSDSWIDDAKRRDLTINALYADMDGSIYDPLDQGFKDLENHIVRFIGDPHKRIAEDHLRILRFFRFYAEYNDGAPDQNALMACADSKDKIEHLSDERLYDEWRKILTLPNAHRAVIAMSEIGLFNLTIEDANHLKHLIEIQTQLDTIDITARFYILNKLNKYIKNNRMNKFIHSLNLFESAWKGNIKQSLYDHGRDVTLQGLLVIKSRGVSVDDMIISNAINTPIPEYPIVASDIMNRFKIDEGAEVGQKMKAAEQIWIDSDFTLTRDEILERV